MAASAQTLAGKEQSGWLNTVSQIAGLASTATSIAGGFVNGGPQFDNSGNMIAEKTGSAFSQAGTFGKVMQITQATGTALSMTSQASTLIKQANGKETGDFENILNTVGFSLTTAASLGQIGIKISDAAKAKKEGTDNTDLDSTDKKDKKDKVENGKKSDDKVKGNKKSDEKATDDKTSKEDDKVDDTSNTNNDGNTTVAAETVESTPEVQEQKEMVQAAEEAAAAAETPERRNPKRKC